MSNKLKAIVIIGIIMLCGITYSVLTEERNFNYRTTNIYETDTIISVWGFSYIPQGLTNGGIYWNVDNQSIYQVEGDFKIIIVIDDYNGEGDFRKTATTMSGNVLFDSASNVWVGWFLTTTEPYIRVTTYVCGYYTLLSSSLSW